MDNKRIHQALNSGKRYGDRSKGLGWAELILLYEDGTWEKVFEYRWDHPGHDRLFQTNRLAGITRKEALVKLAGDYYAGKIEGIFMA